MSTHNICFCGEIRKILCGYPLSSVAMFETKMYLAGILQGNSMEYPQDMHWYKNNNTLSLIITNGINSYL